MLTTFYTSENPRISTYMYEEYDSALIVFNEQTVLL